ncbi:MAG: hypothetical protein BGN88_00390 [Clostridiales bacterium 43-6]|nr:MAG: hypothetical protein BGN88_00390 [Clostridiales bacterium 43-6]
MRINLETDYAVRIVQCLAQAGQRLDANTIAQKTGVTLRFSLKILRKLVGAGIVKSFKGASGGYLLQKAPEDITLLEVIEIISGPIVISRCQSVDYVCDHPDECSCSFQHLFYEVSKEIAERFAKVNFADKERCKE